MRQMTQRAYDVTKDATIALFSLIVKVAVGFDIDTQVQGFDAETGELMVQEPGAWTFHPGEEYEMFFQMAYQPRGWMNEAERDQRQLAWVTHYLDRSFTPAWMLPKFHFYKIAVRTPHGIAMIDPQEHLQRFALVRLGEELARVIEEDWVYLWQSEPRNARD